jgi:hypothetical protein
MALNNSTIKENLSIPSPPNVESRLLYEWLKKLVKSLNEWIRTTANTVNIRPQVGLAADRPPISPGYSGRMYLATDTKVLSFDDGNGNWLTVNLV